MQLLNKSSEILHKFVSLIFSDKAVLKATVFKLVAERITQGHQK